MTLEVATVIGVGMGPEVERVEDQNVPRTRENSTNPLTMLLRVW